MKVHTIKGEIEFDSLDIQDVIELGDNHRKITTEFRLDGEIVRQDVAISILRGVSSEAIEGIIGG